MKKTKICDVIWGSDQITDCRVTSSDTCQHFVTFWPLAAWPDVLNSVLLVYLRVSLSSGPWCWFLLFCFCSCSAHSPAPVCLPARCLWFCYFCYTYHVRSWSTLSPWVLPEPANRAFCFVTLIHKSVYQDPHVQSGFCIQTLQTITKWAPSLISVFVLCPTHL